MSLSHQVLVRGHGPKGRHVQRDCGCHVWARPYGNWGQCFREHHMPIFNICGKTFLQQAIVCFLFCHILPFCRFQLRWAGSNWISLLPAWLLKKWPKWIQLSQPSWTGHDWNHSWLLLLGFKLLSKSKFCAGCNDNCGIPVFLVWNCARTFTTPFWSRQLVVLTVSAVSIW